jgi:hypothetical protein
VSALGDCIFSDGDCFDVLILAMAGHGNVIVPPAGKRGKQSPRLESTERLRERESEVDPIYEITRLVSLGGILTGFFFLPFFMCRVGFGFFPFIDFF